MQAKTFEASKINYTIYYAKGKVVGKDKNFETKISGGGGGGASYQGTGVTNSVSIQSTTFIHDKIYLQQEDGKETAVQLTNWDIACREGHEIMAVWIVKEKEKNGTYVAIKNFTTDTEQIAQNQIKTLANNIDLTGCLPLLLAIPIFYFGSTGNTTLFALAGMASLVFMVYIIFIIYTWTKKNKSRYKVINSELRNFLETTK